MPSGLHPDSLHWVAHPPQAAVILASVAHIPFPRDSPHPEKAAKLCRRFPKWSLANVLLICRYGSSSSLLQGGKILVIWFGRERIRKYKSAGQWSNELNTLEAARIPWFILHFPLTQHSKGGSGTTGNHTYHGSVHLIPVTTDGSGLGCPNQPLIFPRGEGGAAETVTVD